jgi:hypothetical protein
MSEYSDKMDARRNGKTLVELLRDEEIGCAHVCLCEQAAAEIERLEIALSAETERCAKIADGMESVQNIGDRIRYGLGREITGRK